MIDTNALRGVIAANGLSQQDVAREIGISSKSFYSKMKKGVFGSNEMEAMIDLLSIERPQEIFFAKKST